jgi:hypothetical protein
MLSWWALYMVMIEFIYVGMILAVKMDLISSSTRQ